MGDLTDNFSRHEFACPCCGAVEMHPEFLQKLQALREEWGEPFSAVAGGGYRCLKKNGRSTGAHLLGRAIDPDLPRESYFKFIQMAMKHGFTGIGVKSKRVKGVPRFQLHIDDMPENGPLFRPFVWTY